MTTNIHTIEKIDRIIWSQPDPRARIGFYRPDPGHRGKSPNILIERNGSKLTVFEVGSTTLIEMDIEDWMGMKEMRDALQSSVMDRRFQPGGSMADMRDRLLSGYIDVICTAIQVETSLIECFIPKNQR